MKKLVPVILASIYLLTFSFWANGVNVPKAEAAQTATLAFANPANNGSVSLNASNQFTIDVNLNTMGQDAGGADVYVVFEPAKISFVSATINSSMFAFAQRVDGPGHGNNSTQNQVQMGAVSQSNYNNSGRFATLTFSCTTAPTDVNFSFYLAPPADNNITAPAPSYADLWNQNSSPALIHITAYVPPVATPLITSLNPNNGALAGGYDVVINGDATRNFGTTTGTVTWNGAARSLKTGTSWSATQLTVVAPAGTASGTVPVTVTNATTSLTSAAVNFTYNAATSTTPNISSIVPSQGPEAGGTSVTLTGTNFGTNEGTVTVDGTAVSPSVVTWTSATSITFTTPAHAVSADTAVNVSITTAGTSPLTSSNVQFTYINEGTTVVDPTNPDISYLSPISGRADQDITVTIYGSNFGSAQGTVKFGAYPATITSWSTGTIVVHAPQLGVIPADIPYIVTVTRTDGKLDTAYYTYTAPPSTGGTGTPGGTTTTPGGNTTTPNSGMPTGAWAGIISANGVLAFLIKRRLF